MNYLELCELGYEEMASFSSYEDIFEFIDYYMKSGFYMGFHIVDYSGPPDSEDRFRLMLYKK